jgi:hypothetical protein
VIETDAVMSSQAVPFHRLTTGKRSRFAPDTSIQMAPVAGEAGADALITFWRLVGFALVVVRISSHALDASTYIAKSLNEESNQSWPFDGATVGSESESVYVSVEYDEPFEILSGRRPFVAIVLVSSQIVPAAIPGCVSDLTTVIVSHVESRALKRFRATLTPPAADVVFHQKSFAPAPVGAAGPVHSVLFAETLELMFVVVRLAPPTAYQVKSSALNFRVAFVSV